MCANRRLGTLKTYEQERTYNFAIQPRKKRYGIKKKGRGIISFSSQKLPLSWKYFAFLGNNQKASGTDGEGGICIPLTYRLVGAVLCFLTTYLQVTLWRNQKNQCTCFAFCGYLSFFHSQLGLLISSEQPLQENANGGNGFWEFQLGNLAFVYQSLIYKRLVCFLCTVSGVVTAAERLHGDFNVFILATCTFRPGWAGRNLEEKLAYFSLFIFTR